MSEYNEETFNDLEQIKARLKKISVGENVPSNPKVSVVIPVYNNAPFIAATLESVFAQTFQNFEIILINDGSPDTFELEKVLQPFKNKIVYAEQENAGPSKARNAAICLARGEIIAFLDGDDQWLPDFLQAQFEALDGENAAMIYCDAFLFGEPSVEGKKYSTNSPSNGAVTTESLIGGECNVITSGTILKKNALEKSGLFDTTLRGMEDFDLWFRLLKSGAKITYRRGVSVRYRINSEGLSGSNLQIARRCIVALDVIKDKHVLTAGEEKVWRARMNEFFTRLEIELGKTALAENRLDDARNHLVEANKISRSRKISFLLFFLKLFPGALRKYFKLARPEEFNSANAEKDESEIAEAKTPSLKTQGVWLLFSKIVGLVFAFLLPLIVVRFLDRESVGVYRQSFLVILNAVSFLSLGFAMSAFYYLSRETERRASAIANILLFHFAMGGIAFLTLTFFPQILGGIFQSAEMSRHAPLIGAIIWIWIFSMFLETVAVANRDVAQATVFIIFAQISKTLFLAGSVYFFQTVDALLYAALLQGFLQTLILLFYLQKKFPGFHKSFDLKFFGEHLVYALPFGFAGVLWMLQNDIHNYFVGYRFSEADYAIYAYGCFQLPLVSMVVESVGAVLIPRMSELELKNDKEEMLRLTARAMEKLALVCLPVFTFLLITAEVFVVTLFTREYAQSIPIFTINIFLIPFFIPVSDPVVRAYKDLGNFLLKIRMIIFVLLVGALYFGIQHFDLRGMIAIVVVTNSVEKLVIQLIVARKLNFNSSHFALLKNIGKIFGLCVFAGAITFAVYHFVKNLTPPLGEKIAGLIFSQVKPNAVDFISGVLTLTISFAVFAAVYFSGVFFGGILDDGEKNKVKKLFGKLGWIFKKRGVAGEQFQ